MHKFSLNRIDFSILLPSLAAVFLGMALFYSIDTQIFRQQFFAFVVGIFVYVVFLNIDYRIFGAFPKYLYIFMIAALSVIFIIGIEARGAVRWVDIFGIRIQFSEVIKPFFIIFMAYFLAKDESRGFGKFAMALALLAPIFFLTLNQPDLGNAMIFFLVLIFMLISAGFPLRYFLGFGVAGLALFPLIFSLLHDYQKTRLLTFINPTSDPFGSSYNAVQSLISIGSGGGMGKGIGEGTQTVVKFLPERHTDFVFATISESLGMLGAFLLLSLYALLLWKLYRLSLTVNDEFTRLMVLGFYFVFISHIFLNIGMNLGIVPIVGITLPLVSYGGSSLITFFLIIGIVSSIAFEFKKRTTLEIG
jgi:rod shape determining protein RodA